MSLAAGEQALQALITCAREHAGTLEAHEAEQGLFTRLLPMGLAAMQRSFAQCGTGDVGPAVTRADGVLLPRETPLRGRDSCLALRHVRGGPDLRPHARGARDRPAGRPGQPARAVRLVRPAGMDDVVRGRAPLQGACGWFAPLFDLEVAESVLMEVAQEAPEDYERFSAQRPVAPEESAGALLVVRVDGTGVPMMKAEAVTLKATWGTGRETAAEEGSAGGGLRHG